MKRIMKITFAAGVVVALMAFASASVGASTKAERFIYVDAGDYYGNYEAEAEVCSWQNKSRDKQINCLLHNKRQRNKSYKSKCGKQNF